MHTVHRVYYTPQAPGAPAVALERQRVAQRPSARAPELHLVVVRVPSAQRHHDDRHVVAAAAIHGGLGQHARGHLARTVPRHAALARALDAAARHAGGFLQVNRSRAGLGKPQRGRRQSDLQPLAMPNVPARLLSDRVKQAW